jgi:hypothetical protein
VEDIQYKQYFRTDISLRNVGSSHALLNTAGQNYSKCAIFKNWICARLLTVAAYEQAYFFIYEEAKTKN